MAEAPGSVTIGSFSLTRDGALFLFLFFYFLFYVPIFYGELWQSGEQKIDSRSTSTTGPAAVSDSPDCLFSPHRVFDIQKKKKTPRGLLPASKYRSIKFCAIMSVIRHLSGVSFRARKSEDNRISRSID